MRSFKNLPYEVATLVVAHPAGDGTVQFAGMTADLGHILTLAGTLQWPQGAPGAASPPPPQATPAISQAFPSGLTVEAYRTGHGENLTSPDLLDAGFQPIPNGAGERRLAYRQPWATEAGVSAALARFGYRLEGGKLTRKGEILEVGLRPLGPISINRTGDNFALGLLRIEDYAKFLLDKDGLHDWKSTLPPVYLGNDLITEDMSPDWQIEVQSGGEAFSSAAATPHPAGDLHGMYAWDDHWALETTGSVLIDRQPQEATRRASGCACWAGGHSISSRRTGASTPGTMEKRSRWASSKWFITRAAPARRSPCRATR